MKLAYHDDKSYGSFFEEGRPLEIHLKIDDGYGAVQYLAKKHKGFTSSIRARIDVEDFKVLACYSKKPLASYKSVNGQYLWVLPRKLRFIESNSMAKHALERMED